MTVLIGAINDCVSIPDSTTFAGIAIWNSPATGVPMARITEGEIAEIVEAYLKEKTSGRASIKELVQEIPNRVSLSSEDLAQSTTRANEAIWEQQVRNITSHKGSPGNAIYEGRLVAISGGLALPGKEGDV